MKKKKSTQYANLPHYIYLQPNRRYQNTLTGKWLSEAELMAYTSPKEEITIKEHKQTWQSNYDNY